jgi:hypothetical protein
MPRAAAKECFGERNHEPEDNPSQYHWALVPADINGDGNDDIVHARSTRPISERDPRFSMIDRNSKPRAEAWRRLLAGDVGAIPQVDGRLDLRGSAVQKPKSSSVRSSPIAVSEVQSGLIELRGVTWKGIDFTGSDLPELRFFDGVIEDCVFDECDCRGWRMWNTRLARCSFTRADLRKSALGGLMGAKRNEFREVQFVETDLRQTAFTAAKFEGCVFENARLDRVDFQGSEFARCTFVGTLQEVAFARRAFRVEGTPENQMKGVDFSRASLRSVEFRDLDLGDVVFPTDADHLVVEPYRPTLDAAISELEQRDAEEWKALRAYLIAYRKRAGPNQRRGVFNRAELKELTGESAAGLLESIMRRE